MKRKFFDLALSTLLLVLCFPAEAQQPTKIPRIGFLFVNFASSTPARYEAFRQGLRELGYVEGKRYHWSVSNPCRQGSKCHDSRRHVGGY